MEQEGRTTRKVEVSTERNIDKSNNRTNEKATKDREKAGSLAGWVKVMMSVLLVLGNVGFLLVSGVIFVRVYLRDRKKAKRRRRTTKSQGTPETSGMKMALQRSLMSVCSALTTCSWWIDFRAL